MRQRKRIPRLPSALTTFLIALASTVFGQILPESSTPEQLEKLGEGRYRQGRPDLALPFFAKVIEKRPERVSALLATARIVESDFQDERALALFRRVLAIEPENREALAGVSRLAPTPEDRLSAARLLAEVTSGEDAGLAREQVRALEALAGRRVFAVVDRRRSYSFQLQRGRPDPALDPGWQDYPVLNVVAPNGRILNLLIGTATDGIWLTQDAARR